MMPFDRHTLGRTAKELGFVRDTLEKVYRLAEVLRFMGQDELLSKSLALKGGTAINLTIFNLPRLSVDIDLDYCLDFGREEMLANRSVITDKIDKYMAANGYRLSPKSKTYHALDSFVYEYENSGGVKDNLKIEINYVLRSHVFAPAKRRVVLPGSEADISAEPAFSVLSVVPVEIFASKTAALLYRTAPRDLYDVHNMIKYGLFGESEKETLRRCAVFYAALGAERADEAFDIELMLKNVERVTAAQIKRDLKPVLRRDEYFELDAVKKEVKEYLSELLHPTEREKEFLKRFARGLYDPELIFGDSEETKNISEHPMALWKCAKRRE